MTAKAAKIYKPHIMLQTALSICGADLIEASGMIAGLAIKEDHLQAAIKRHVLPDVRTVMEKLNTRIAEYEARVSGSAS